MLLSASQPKASTWMRAHGHDDKVKMKNETVNISVRSRMMLPADRKVPKKCTGCGADMSANSYHGIICRYLRRTTCLSGHDL